jgi:murein L,D-transpeptidase YcbB/YkuD
MISKAAVAALTLSCAMVIAAPTAQSATLLDFLRGKTTKNASTPGNAGSLDDDLGQFPQAAHPDAPLPKVSAPRYFTYKADPLRLIAVSKFAPLAETASADPSQVAQGTDANATGSIQTVSLTPQVDFSQNPRALIGDVRVKAPAEVADAIEKFYSTHQGVIWVDANGVTDKARAALAYLAKVDAVGLDPADYHVIDPTDTFAGVDAATKQRQLMQFEMELSTAALTFVEDTVRGRIDPNRIAEYYDFKRKDVNLLGALNIISMSHDVAAYLDSRNPSNPQFDALKAELAKVRTETGGDAKTIVINLTSTLKPGASSPELPNIIASIRIHGSDALKVAQSVTLASYKDSQEYTPDLVELVKAFQAEKGMHADGVIGRGTVKALSGGADNSATKINKLNVAMEEMRWLPEDLGSRYVFINQPAFTAYYHNNNQEQFNMRVVVGSPAHQTFFFEDQIELVEFNPYWGVPHSIIVNEMLPHLRQDPSYLDRLGYETSINGQQVSSSSVDWYSNDSVDVRQPPGNGNALGQLKIMFPNSHAIYMHDTPQKSFFKRDMRALSHGCVRLSDPKKMAAAVMDMSVDQINAEISTGQNHQLKTPEKFPIYVAYFTAYPNKDGVVEYFDDVYGRDTYMDKAFDTTAKVRHVDS